MASRGIYITSRTLYCSVPVRTCVVHLLVGRSICSLFLQSHIFVPQCFRRRPLCLLGSHLDGLFGFAHSAIPCRGCCIGVYMNSGKTVRSAACTWRHEYRRPVPQHAYVRVVAGGQGDTWIGACIREWLGALHAENTYSQIRRPRRVLSLFVPASSCARGT